MIYTGMVRMVIEAPMEVEADDQEEATALMALSNVDEMRHATIVDAEVFDVSPVSD